MPTVETHAGPVLDQTRGLRRRMMDSVAWRLFFTVWLIYTFHFASDVVRETYLAIALAEDASIRVDEYMGLHPDLFQMEGRGAFINNNPGASIMGAVPYAIARPAFELLYRWKPGLIAPKPDATYDDPRPNRNKFFDAVRARGLDIKLGLAAAAMHAGLMVPLGAAAAVAVFLYLRTTLKDERKALWLALLYAFGTPIFFRSAFLNQNVLIAHAMLVAFLAASSLARDHDDTPATRRLLLIGLMAGVGLLCDYSAMPLAIVFGLWVIALGWRRGGVHEGVSWGLKYVAGAAGPIALLLAYQWAAFGNPLLPAQSYMPPTRYSVLGWNGFFWPNPELLWRNLLDPAFGLFMFCPLLVLALFAPLLKHRAGGLQRNELWLTLGVSGALYLFLSCVAFAFLQWNTGVRYMVPAVPLLFFAAVPVLLRLPDWARYAVVIPTVSISWAVSMTRDGVPGALSRIFLQGFELPWLTVLRKTSSGYLASLSSGASPIAIFVLLAVILWLVWRPYMRSSTRPLA